MDADWMEVGKCKDLSPSIFFPSDGVGVQEAQRICAECPVADQCLEYALTERVDHGVWGGKSERVDKAHDICGEIVIAIAVGWCAGIPVTASIRHDNVVILLQHPC